MPDYATNVADLQRQIQEAIDRLAKELKRIDEKITPVVERAEASHPDKELLNANLELKASYIEQEKQAVIIQALIAVQQLISASLDLEVRRAQAEAEAAAAQAASEKAQHAAEKKAKQDEADAQAKADDAKGQADAKVAAAQAQANADKAKADADLAAAKAKADAERDAAQKDADSDKQANDAKKAAALKKAEQDAIKAMIEALTQAASTFKASASTISEIKKMKDDLEKEIKDGGAPIVDGPAQ